MIVLFLTPWASRCSISPKATSTSCALSTAATKIWISTAHCMRWAGFSPEISISRRRRRQSVELARLAASLRDGHEREYMAADVIEIKSAAAVPMVEFAITQAPRRAADSDVLFFYAREDGVKF